MRGPRAGFLQGRRLPPGGGADDWTKHKGPLTVSGPQAGRGGCDQNNVWYLISPSMLSSMPTLIVGAASRESVSVRRPSSPGQCFS